MMSINMDMGSPPVDHVVLASIAFAIFWVLAVFPTVPCLPIGRTAGSLLGAMLMVLFRVITPDQAYAAIDLPILGLLFGTMVVGIYLERADMFKYLRKLVTWNSMGPNDLICRICLISAISSSLFTNDTVCVILTKFVLELAAQHNLPPHPFLLALATSANIGSAATPIGNPQNLIIATKSKISFGDFLLGILPAMLAGLMANALLLLCMYRTTLLPNPKLDNHVIGKASDQYRSDQSNDEVRITVTSTSNYTDDDHSSNSERISDKEIPLLPKKPDRLLLHGAALSIESYSLKAEIKKEYLRLGRRWEIRRMWKPCVYLVTVGMLISFLLGYNMSWTAITGALTLILLDFADAQPCLKKVSYPLLIFFCGMFITVDGFNRTGIPSTLWNLVEPYARINDALGRAVLAIVILFLSNLASNVPAVLLLGVPVAVSATAISAIHEKKAWLILAWVSTVAGNLSLFGSAANLIVCEQAREEDCELLSFWEHLKFGVPSTLVVTAIGLAFM